MEHHGVYLWDRFSGSLIPIKDTLDRVQFAFDKFIIEDFDMLRQFCPYIIRQVGKVLHWPRLADLWFHNVPVSLAVPVHDGPCLGWSVHCTTHTLCVRL